MSSSGILSNSFPPELYYYYVSSKDRVNHTSTDSTTSNFEVPGIQVYRPSKIILKSVRFPKTMYVVNENNNKFTFGLSYNPVLPPDEQATLTAVVPVGHYTSATFCPALLGALNDAVVGSDPFVTVFVDDLTSEVVIRVADGSTIVYYNTPLYSTNINTLIGFDDKSLVRGPGLPSAPGTTRDNISGTFYMQTRFGNTINLAGCTSIFLCSAYLANKSTIRCSNSRVGNVVAVIPVGDFGYGDIVNSVVDHVYDWHSDGTIDFRLLDDTGRQVNLNGGDVELTLAIIPQPGVLQPDY